MKVLKENEIVGTFPTSVTQKRCWFMEQIHPGNKGLNLAVRWELRGPVSEDAVENAFQQIVDRHEIFRTRFAEQDGEPFQEVMAHVDFKLDRLDIRNVPESDREERIRNIAVEHAEEPFDLASPGLFRVAMVRIEPERAALLISVHNSVFDGFSIGILGHELGTILAAMEKGQVPNLPDLPLQYGDYAMWLADYEASGAMAEEEDYWAKTLMGMRYFEVPSDRPRVAAQPENRSCARELPDNFENRLAEAAKAMGTTVFTLGTAAFGIALERFTGRRDVSFAVQVAGRNEIDLEPMIGIFTNPIVLRFDVDGGGKLNDHVRASHEVVNGALTHQTLPFDRLVQILNPPRDPLRIPLVSVMFNLQHAFLKEQSYGSVELVSVQSHSPGTLYDLNVNIVGRKSGWRMMIDYNARLFDEATVGQLSDLVIDVFEAVVRQPDKPIAEFRVTRRTTEQTSTGKQEKAGRTPLAAEPVSRGKIKGQLAAVWAEILSLPEEKVDANFFDLGGYSSLALRMLAKIGDMFAYRPSLHAFLADPTLDGLAALLSRQAAVHVESAEAMSQIWDLAELRSASTQAPVLVTVNQPFMYQALAKDIQADCAVVNLGITSPEQLLALSRAGFDEAMEEAAALVRSQYSGRPLILCGLCVDGRAALRLAQCLTRENEAVSCVAMIDTWAPGAVREFSAFARWRDRWTVRLRRLRYYLGLGWRGEIGTLDVLLQNDFAANLLRRLGRAEPRAEIETLVDETVDKLVEQTRAYKFDPYDGEVALFVTRSQALVPRDGVLGWSWLLSPDVSVYSVNGWHGDALLRTGFDRITGVLDAKAQRLTRTGRSKAGDA